MTTRSLAAISWIVALLCIPAFTQKTARVEISRPTVIAFFPPVSDKEMENNADLNEALSDFQLYAQQTREALKTRGIDFHEIYARRLSVRDGNKVVTFTPEKIPVGYVFVAPGRKPQVEHGVMVPEDILNTMDLYLRHADSPAESSQSPPKSKHLR